MQRKRTSKSEVEEVGSEDQKGRGRAGRCGKAEPGTASGAHGPERPFFFLCRAPQARQCKGHRGHTHRWVQQPPRRGARTRRREEAAGEGRAGGKEARGPGRGRAPGRRGRRGGRWRLAGSCSPLGAAAGSCCRAGSWLIAPGRRSVGPGRAPDSAAAGRLRAEPVTPARRAWCGRGQGSRLRALGLGTRRCPLPC